MIDEPRFSRDFSLSDWITPEISVRSLLDIFRRMDGTQGTQTLFSEIDIPNDRTVWGGSHQLDRVLDPAHHATNQILFGCSTGWGQGWRHFWEITIWFNCSARSFDYVTVPNFYDPDREDTFWRFRESWFVEDIDHIRLDSFEDENQFSNDVRSFWSSFRETEKKISNPDDWDTGGLSARILCNCGHSKTTSGTKLAKNHNCKNIFSLERMMRCSSCATKGSAKILPVFASDDTNHISQSRRYFGVTLRREANSAHLINRSEDLYDIMDGDGENDVYLADGLYIRPDGSTYEG